MGHAPPQIAHARRTAPLTRRGLAVRAALAASIYVAIMQAFPFVDGPVARAVAAASDVLFFKPGFGVGADFDSQQGPRGTELFVHVEHPPSGLVATNRLDLRFRLWVPLALFVALVVVSPETARRRTFALGVGAAALTALALLSSWLVAMYPVVIAPENMLGLGTAPRVAFNTVYSVLILSNPSAALMPVLLWGITMRRCIGESISLRGNSGSQPPLEAPVGPRPPKRR